VELGPSGLANVAAVPAPVHRRLSVLRGTLAELLTDPAHCAAEGDFVSATLTDPVRPDAPMERLRARFPHTLSLTFEPIGAFSDPRSYTERVRGRADLDLAVEFVSYVRGAVAGPEESALLASAFQAVRVAADADPIVACGRAPAEVRSA
jgi:exonuclease SbcD